MITSTATAKRPPRARPSASSSLVLARGRLGRRENASGTTTSETNGAAAMPIATTDSPLAIPIAAATANSSRAVASMNTSPP